MQMIKNVSFRWQSKHLAGWLGYAGIAMALNAFLTSLIVPVLARCLV